jgi:hypothetical protein
MMFRQYVCLMTAILMAGLFSRCSNDSDTPTPQSTDPIVTPAGTPTGDATQKTIGEGGGTVQSADGRLTVTIPAGALTEATNISIQPLSNEAPLGMGLGYRLGPEGTTFAVPVTLTFAYDDALLNGVPEEFLWIVTQAENGTWNAMLRSGVDAANHSVSVETTHFSDWALGKFLDLALAPSSAALMKGQSIGLTVFGFLRDQPDEVDENGLEILAPLVPIVDDGLDYLAPLTPIPPVESRIMDFRVKGWTLNGVAAPTSGANGKLAASNLSANYTAPTKTPSRNPVAVTVELEGSNKEAKKTKFLLTSNIKIIESDYYLLVTIDGTTYEYYQYGFNGSVPPDPNDVRIANCGMDDEGVMAFGGTYATGATMTNSFLMAVEAPSVGTRPLVCHYADGKDDVAWGPAESLGWSMAYTKRTQKKDYCDYEMMCGAISLTITKYDTKDKETTGHFSGKIYEDKPSYDDECKTADEHTVSGEFHLVVVN